VEYGVINGGLVERKYACKERERFAKADDERMRR